MNPTATATGLDSISKPQRRMVERLVALAHKRIDQAFPNDPEQAKAFHDQVDVEVGKIDPANLAAFLAFLTQLLTTLLPLIIPLIHP